MTIYDKTVADRLCREARGHGMLLPADEVIDTLRSTLTRQCADTPVSHIAHDAQATLWQLQQIAKTNAGLADQLEAAGREIERLKEERDADRLGETPEQFSARCALMTDARDRQARDIANDRGNEDQRGR